MADIVHKVVFLLLFSLITAENGSDNNNNSNSRAAMEEPEVVGGGDLMNHMNKTIMSEEELYPLRCECHPEDRCWPKRNYCRTKYQCYKAIPTDRPEEYRLGCLGLEIQDDFLCRAEPKKFTAIACCKDYDRCNTDLNITVTKTTQEAPPSEAYYDKIIYISLPFGVLCIILLIILLLCNYRHKNKMQQLNKQEQALLTNGDLRAEAVGDNTLRELLEESCTSGSGSGLPFLVQQTVARQVQLLECIGQGRYGEVWKGKYRGEMVAVKIFLSRDESSWFRETEIYNTCLLRHENILGYYASDMTSRNSCTQLWLIMQYYENGSLYDYLQHNTLDHEKMLRMMHSAASGLVHLHTEILGNRGKPAIAHRDIKSKNILVKRDGTTCIADLGLAVLHKCENNRLDLGANNKVGTKRYMAPELLDETLNPEVFDSFKCVDIYAFSLVLWEIARRCYSQGIVEDYKPPFWDKVPSDPSFDDMRRVVATEHYRPVIPNRWASDSVLSPVSRVIRECWNQNPKARLTVLRLKKTLRRLWEVADDEKFMDKSVFKEKIFANKMIDNSDSMDYV